MSSVLIPFESSTQPVAADAVLVIGLGNLLLGDEGVGIHMLRHLEIEYTFTPAITCVDGGTAGLDLLTWFADYRRILMLDALFSNEHAPGQCCVLRNENILAALTAKISLHHLGISDVLALTQLLNYPRSEWCLVGIAPAIMELGVELSPVVRQQLPVVIEQTRAVLAEWGITSHHAAIQSAAGDSLLFTNHAR